MRTGIIYGKVRNNNIFSDEILEHKLVWETEPSEDGNFSTVSFKLYVTSFGANPTYPSVMWAYFMQRFYSDVANNVNDDDFDADFNITQPNHSIVNGWKSYPAFLFSNEIDINGAGEEQFVGEFKYIQYHKFDGTFKYASENPKIVLFTESNDTSNNQYQDFGAEFNLGSIEFEPTNRGVRINTADNFTDEENPKITYISDPDGITSLQAGISLDGENILIPYREISRDETTYTFNLTEEERELLRTNTTQSAVVPVWFFLKTVRQQYSSSEPLEWLIKAERSLTIIGCNPIVNPTVRDINPTSLALTNNEDVIVRYVSTAEFNVGSVASKHATIIGQSVQCGSKTVSNIESGTIEKVESGTFVFSATDSRNLRADPVTVQKETIDYVKLTCNQKIEFDLSGETDAKAQVTISGNYYHGSFGAVDNELILQIRHTQNDGQMGDWVTLTDGLVPIINGTTYELDITISGFKYNMIYTFQCRAIDKIGMAETPEYRGSVTPVFDWSKEDFNFNVPVSFQGDMMNDIVIETGTEEMGSNGTWYWRKWKSGKAECYGCRNFGVMSVGTAWGSLYRSESFYQSLPSGLFVATPEVIDITFRGSNYGGWVAKHEAYEASESSSGGFIVVRPANATLENSYIGFNAIGRWK